MLPALGNFSNNLANSHTDIPLSIYNHTHLRSKPLAEQEEAKGYGTECSFSAVGMGRIFFPPVDLHKLVQEPLDIVGQLDWKLLRMDH